ncbi:hypothetical protein KI387_030105, partial [Taxus chinensis]
LGQPGQKYVWGTNRLICCKMVYCGQFRDFRSGQPGQKYAQDAKRRNGRRQETGKPKSVDVGEFIQDSQDK